MELVTAALNGDRRALARLLSQVEDDSPNAREILQSLFPHTGRAHIIGITGFAGVGKSTLVSALTKELRRQGKTVGIVAIDPTSVTGGAFLGDRIRMGELSGDKDVFIRSMATRGHVGGVARATLNIIRVLDAAGFSHILVETVGAGQSEIEIAHLVHTTIVIEVPGLGDDIQALKAGLLEIADIFVVNKADSEGADRVAITLETMLDLAETELGWYPPILKAVAVHEQGITEIVEAISQHYNYLRDNDCLEQQGRVRIENELKRLLSQELLRDFLSRLEGDAFSTIVAKVHRRDLDPYSAITDLLQSSTTKFGQRG